MKELRNEDDNTKHLSPSIVEGTAGFAAGVAATLVAHPFDLIKTRLQSTNSVVRLFLHTWLSDSCSKYHKSLGVWNIF